MFSVPDISLEQLLPPKPPDKTSESDFRSVKNRKRAKIQRNKNDLQNNTCSENIYDSLNDDEDDDSHSMVSCISDSSSYRRKPVRKTHPKKTNSNVKIDKKVYYPPITVMDLNINEVFIELNKLNLKNNESVQTKLTQHGIKVLTSDLENFKIIKEEFQKRNIKFYTHCLKEDQKTKIVLYGLPDMEPIHVKTELEKHNVFPEDVKKLKIKSQKYISQCHYLLYFIKSKKVQIADLRKVKALFSIVVKWQYYSKHNSSPTQCSNCQKFGHGNQNCFLKAKCLKCGEDHQTNNCIYNVSTSDHTLKPSIPKEKVKCANCNHQHTANYSKCTNRLEYLEYLNKLRQNNRIKSNKNSYGFVNSPELYNLNFPAFSGENGKPTNNNSWQNKNPQNSKSNDMFTPAECMDIFNEFVNKLRSCKTKEDQIKIIGEITFKYLLN